MHLFTHLTARISTCSCLLYIESRCKYLLCFSEAVLLCMQMLLSGLYRTEWVERCPACRADRFTFLSPGVSDKILFVELIFCFLSKLFLQNLEWKLILESSSHDMKLFPTLQTFCASRWGSSRTTQMFQKWGCDIYTCTIDLHSIWCGSYGFFCGCAGNWSTRIHLHDHISRAQIKMADLYACRDVIRC